MGFFRDEVIAAKRGQSTGALLVVMPPSIRLLAALGIVFLAALVAILFFAEYTSRERVSGELVPIKAPQSGQARSSGVVSDVYVAEGQSVTKGQKLVRISLDVGGETGSSAFATVRQKLQQQHAQLAAEINDQSSLRESERGELNGSANNLSARIAAFDEQIVLQKRLIDSSAERVERFRPLVKDGYVSGMQMEQQEADVVQKRSGLEGLLRDRLQAVQELAAVRSSLQQYPERSRSERSEAERSLIAIEQELAKNEAQREITLRASQDGVVTNLLAMEGRSVTAGQPLFQVTQPDSPLRARLLIESRAVGLLQEGQPVVLRYPAFPYQKYGQHIGTVESVSRNALRADESAVFTDSVAKREQLTPLYQVVVALDEQRIVAGSSHYQLRPGMQVEADLLIEKRRLAEWLFEPLIGIQRRMAASESPR